MIRTTPIVNKDNPWPGLAAFDEDSGLFFNGRDQEIAALLRLVSHEHLTVLFGASGLGKTSLLLAGLFPKIRHSLLPVYIRLDFRDRDSSLMHQVRLALLDEVKQRSIEAPAIRESESLWKYLHRANVEFWSKQNRLLLPLLVFDQFEEVFTLGAGNPQGVSQFRAELANLIENRVPEQADEGTSEAESTDGLLEGRRYKVLLNFREDFLPVVEEWKKQIPSILRNRLRLLPMSAEQAFEAVHSTAPQLAPEPIARRIVTFVAEAGEKSLEDRSDKPVEPALLSLVCAGLNERRKKTGKKEIDDELLASAGQAILVDYYDNAVRGLRKEVRRFIQKELITERGFRKPSYRDDARLKYAVTDDEIAVLVNRRLLRIESASGAERLELIHDRLAPIVMQRRDLDRKRTRRLAALQISAAVLAVLAIAATAIIMARLSLKEKNALDSQTKALSLATKYQDAQKAFSDYQDAVISEQQSIADEVRKELRSLGAQRLAARLGDIDDIELDENLVSLRNKYIQAARQAATVWYQLQTEIGDSNQQDLAPAHPTRAPAFAQPETTPDPVRFETPHSSDTLAYEILDGTKAQPLHFPRYAADEPVFRLGDAYGLGSAAGSHLMEASSITFQAVGSTGSVRGPATQNLVADAMVQDFAASDDTQRPAFFLHLGDIVYNFGETQYYYDQFYAPYRNYPAPILAVAGNHEGNVVPGSTSTTLDAFLRNFCAKDFYRLPEAGGLVRTTEIQPGVYFTLESPLVRILVLYSNMLEDPGVISDQNGTFPQVGRAQLKFLRAALTRIKQEKFKGAIIIAVHHPPYRWAAHSGSPSMRKDIDSICRETGVWPHAVLSGHVTNYQRFTRVVDGRTIPYIIAGSGGHGILHVSPRTSDGYALHTPAKLFNDSDDSDQVTLETYDDTDYGYLSVKVDSQRLTITFHPVVSKSGSGLKPSDRVTVDLSTQRLTSSNLQGHEP